VKKKIIGRGYSSERYQGGGFHKLSGIEKITVLVLVQKEHTIIEIGMN